ncbi:MAG TPA: hypothetical protein VJH03_14515 [Blastocatellia bacterium]|nr:hypothetical protein [Blastocatellia bacterium]
MSIEVDLPEELENELMAEAAQLGLSVPEYVLRVLSTGVVIGKRPKTGAELVEYWQNEGLIGTRADITDSQAHARKIRSQAEQRPRT